MMNQYVLKNWSIFLVAVMLPGLAVYTSLLLTKSTITSAIIMFVVGIACVFVGRKLLANPFTNMYEGKGLIVFKLDSTGIITNFLVNVRGKYIEGHQPSGKNIQEIFNRDKLASSINDPIHIDEKEGYAIFRDDGYLHILMKQESWDKSKFGFAGKPVLIWNDYLKTFLTKQFLSQQEQAVFVEHELLQLRELVIALSINIRDLLRNVADRFNAVLGGIVSSGWFWLVLIVLGGVAVWYFFGQDLLNAGTSAVSGVVSGTQAVQVVG